MLSVLFNLIISINIAIAILYESAGTILFNDKDIKKKCWNSENLTKLHLRSIFETLIPLPPSPNEINAKYVRDILLHYQKSLLLTKRVTDFRGQKLLRESLVDAIGAHMRSELLPAARFAYYAGYLNFVDVDKLNVFYDSLKTHLNTRGLGWKEPSKIPKWFNLTVTKIVFAPSCISNPCERLIIKRDSNSCIYLPKPKIDDCENPKSIALPLRADGLFSLTSPCSENILLDYYITAAKCILEQSPESCRHSDFVTFNNDLWHWMKKYVAPHLMDESLYVAYGGVLRLAAAAQKYSNEHSCHRLPEIETVQLGTNAFWKKLRTPHSMLAGSKFSDAFSDIYVVVIVAVLICLFQVLIYSLVVAFKSQRSKKGSSVRKRHDKNDERSKPSVIYSSESLKTNSQEEILVNTYHKIETVYDLNENKEKIMTIAASDSGSSRAYLKRSASDIGDESEPKIQTERSESPPKLDASITQLCVKKPSAVNAAVFHQASLHSGSGTVPSFCTTFVQRDLNLDCTKSASESSSSDQTISSKDTTMKKRHSCESRDILWARRVIYKHANRKCNSDVILKPVSKVTSEPTFASISNIRD